MPPLNRLTRTLVAIAAVSFLVILLAYLLAPADRAGRTLVAAVLLGVAVAVIGVWFTYSQRANRRYAALNMEHDLFDAVSGQRLGVVRTRGLRSLFRDSWDILDADERPSGEMIEDGSYFWRRVLRFIPGRHHIDLGGRRVAGAGYRLAWAKASEGTSFIDAYYRRNVAAAEAAGIRVGAYDYARPHGKTSTAARERSRLMAVSGLWRAGDTGMRQCYPGPTRSRSASRGRRSRSCSRARSRSCRRAWTSSSAATTSET